MASWIRLLRARWRTGAVVFLLVAAAAAAAVLLTRPVYRAEARMRLGEPPPMGGVSPTSGFFGFLRLGGDPFANDLELLASRSLTESVVSDAALNVALRAPRGWHRDSLLVHLSASRETLDATFSVTWEQDGGVSVRMRAPRDTASWSVRPGDTLELAGIRVAFRPWRPGMPRTVGIRTWPFGEAVRVSGPRLRSQRTRRDANVVELVYDAGDPALAEEVVGSAVRRFVELRTAILHRESRETMDSLRTVAGRTLQELRAAEAEMERFQRGALLVAPEAQGEVLVERYGELVTALERARSEMEAADALLGRVGALTDPAAAWTEVASFPRFLENETVGAFLTRLSHLEEQRAEMATRRSEESREYRVLQGQIRYLDGALRSLARSYRTALTEEVGRLQARVEEMDRLLASVPADLVELGRRQRDVRLLGEILVMTEQRLRQEELREALTFSNVQVIDPPALRHRPVWPRRKLGLGVGVLLASAFGVLAMVVRERSDSAIRTGAELRNLAGAPLVAAVVVGRGGLGVEPLEARALIRSARENGGPASRIVLAPVDGEVDAEALAGAVEQALAGHAEGSATDLPLPASRIEVSPPLDRFAAAAAAAGGTGTSVFLVVRQGRTRRDDLERAVRLVREAGGSVTGAIVVCARGGDASSLWT